MIPLLQLDVEPPEASGAQLRPGNEDKIGHDGPPHFNVRPTGFPNPQSVYVPFADVAMVSMVGRERSISVEMPRDNSE